MGKVCTRHVQRHNCQTIKGTGNASRTIKKKLDCQIVAIVVVTDHNIVHVQIIVLKSHVRCDCCFLISCYTFGGITLVWMRIFRSDKVYPSETKEQELTGSSTIPCPRTGVL